jgi:hypothetical protein
MTNFASFLPASPRLGTRLNEAETSAKPYRFTRNETYQGRFKPAFQSDLEASEAPHSLLSEKIIHPCPRHKALGNHKDRIHTFENENPETYGTYSAAYNDILAQHNWKVTPYRGWLDLEGIDIKHIPMTAVNRPAAGARPAVSMSNKLTRSLLFGHTHLYSLHTEVKFGPAPGRSITVLNGGTFTPDGYVARYAQGTAKQSWYGCHVLEIEAGNIVGHEAITMRQLQQRYS